MKPRRLRVGRYSAADLALLLDGTLPHAVAADVLGRPRRAVARKRGQLERLLGLPRITRAAGAT